MTTLLTRRHQIAALVAVLTLSVLATSASAMTVLKAPLSDLVKTSELVLHGTISKVEVLDLRRQNKGVWTEYTLDVAEAWKGDKRKLGKQFRWRLLGGTTKDGMTLDVPGMPTFARGEETVVLLERHSTGHTLTGAPQGKFHVFRGKKGQKQVRRDLSIANVVHKDARTGKLVSEHLHGLKHHQPSQSLAALRAEIKGYVKAQRPNAKSSRRAVEKARQQHIKR